MAFDPDEHYQRISLRIPRALHEQLMATAKQASRSMNAEIIGRLNESFAIEGELPADFVGRAMNEFAVAMFIAAQNKGRFAIKMEIIDSSSAQQAVITEFSEPLKEGSGQLDQEQHTAHRRAELAGRGKRKP